MRGILIDPFERKITEVELDLGPGGALAEIYRFTRCECVDSTRVPNETGDTCWVDDEGLGRDGQRFFIFGRKMLGGCGLITGIDEIGETVAAKTTVAEIVSFVAWPPEDTYLEGIAHTESEVDHPVFGKVKHIATTPSFRAENPDDTRAATMDDVAAAQ